VKVVLQRVLRASVSVEEEVISAIGTGLLALVGVGAGDTPADALWMAEKVATLRIFEDDAGKMNRSLLDTSKALLAVSQFTLYADTSKGRRPSFLNAMAPETAIELYRAFCLAAERQGLTVSEGIFAADMKVSLVNDGPVTIILDSQHADEAQEY
jgi:D-aminoacyl-tRNA deacylase